MNGKKKSKLSGESIVQFALKNKALVLLIFLSIGLSIMSPYFLTKGNILNVMRQMSVLTIMGIGVTLLQGSGTIDLSIGNLMALVGVVMAILDTRLGWSPVFVIIAGILTSIAGLSLNTFFVQIFQLPSFILTLATSYIWIGLLWVISGGQSIPGISEWFKYLGQGLVFGIPIQVFIMAFVACVFTFIIKRTKLGRQSLALGGNLNAARVCGINVRKIKFLIATLMGFCISIASTITTGRAASAQLSAGSDTAMDTIAAVIIGGTPMGGGYGNVPGTVIGCLLIQVISNGLNLMDVDSNWHKVAKGVIIIIAVVLDIQGTKIINRIRVKNQEIGEVSN